MDVRDNILPFILLFFVIFTNSCADQSGRMILNKIAFSVKDGDRITLSDFTNFEWDNVILCNPGTSLKEYERFLGPVKFEDFDLKEVIIFRKGETVVKVIKRNYHPEKYSRVEFFISTNSYIILNKNEAVFDVVKELDHVELSPVGGGAE